MKRISPEKTFIRCFQSKCRSTVYLYRSFVFFYAKMCPICVTSSSNGSRSRFVLLADHIAAVHDDGTMIHDDDAIQSSSISQTRRIEHEEVTQYSENKNKSNYICSFEGRFR